jgi:transposase-like protein
MLRTSCRKLSAKKRLTQVTDSMPETKEFTLEDRYRIAVTMQCPHCKKPTTVRITRYATRSPQHIDLEFRCELCGEKWQAAEIASQ